MPLRRFRTLLLLLLIACIALVLLQLHNTLSYPMTEGFDAVHHLEYITFIKEYRRLPLPVDGWEMSQQPLYYIIASLLPRPVSPQWIGFSAWLTLALVVSLLVKGMAQRPQLLSKDTNRNLLLIAGSVVCLIMSTPVILALTPAVSNEFFCTVMISICLWFYITHFLPTLQGKNLSLKDSLVLGLLLGLTLLSKASSAVLIATIVLERFLTAKGNLRLVFKHLWLPFLVAFLIGSWFYSRNLLMYGNPFYQAADLYPIEYFDQEIVPRNATFFLPSAAFFSRDLFVAHNSSFLAGTFFSWFYDGHASLLPLQPYTKVGVMIVIFGVGLFTVMVIGSVRAVFTLFRRRSLPNHHLVLLLYTLLMILAYIHYNFKLPIYSVVKGALISSLILPSAYFLYQGLEWLVLKTKGKMQNRLVMAVVLLTVAYAALITRHFWVQAWWY